jgi:hypothetical protein
MEFLINNFPEFATQCCFNIKANGTSFMQFAKGGSIGWYCGNEHNCCDTNFIECADQILSLAPSLEQYFQLLNDGLRKRNNLLIIKTHINTPNYVFQTAANLSNVHVMTSDLDIYSILPFSSALITDYSSVMFDYLLLDKPIYYYTNDKEEFISKNRTFYDYYEFCTVGTHISSLSEIIDINPQRDAKAFAESRRSIRNRFFDHLDPFASDRIIKKISSL